MAEWHHSQTINEDWEQPFGKIFPSIEHSSWFSRYAAFKVKVSYQGRTRDYHALFLFGHDPNTGAEYIIPGDTVVGLTGALHFFLSNGAYPEALIQGSQGREIPAVRDWIMGQAVTGKEHDDNCDPGTGKCGVSQKDLDKFQKLPKRSSRAFARFSRRPYLLDVSLSPHMTVHPMLQTTFTDCRKFNTTNPHTGFIQEFTKHENPGSTSNHTLVDSSQSSCTYADGASSICNIQCKVNVANSSIGDTGPVTGFCHAVNKNFQNDEQDGTGAGADCGGGVGGGVKECISCLCSVSVSISSSGAIVSISSDGFFTLKDGLGQKCAAEPKPTSTSPPPPPPPPAPTPTPSCILSNSCSTKTPPLCDNDPTGGGTGGDKSDLASGCSPIIIDTTGEGFHLTSAANGVKFDISGTGVPVQIAWTDVGYRNAFLVLPGSDGLVHNGMQLFGNFTSQRTSDHPNGFAALAVYDLSQNGGNGDGIIDSRDAIYSKLRLWIDANHDGISQPEELHTLPDIGVLSIGLGYSFSTRTDEFGNVFRYRSKVNQDQQGDSDVGKKAYDVFFVTN